MSSHSAPSCHRRALLAALPALGLAGPAFAQPVTLPPLPPPALPPPVPLPPLGPAQRALAVRTINAAETHGLEHQHVSPDEPHEQIAAALLRYAKEVHVGRLAPADFLYEWGVRPPPYDPRPDLAAALTTDRLDAWLESLPPPYSGYNALRRGLATYRAIAAKGGWRTLSPGPAFGRGEKGPRVAVLRAMLAVEDPAVELAGKAEFDSELQ